MSKPGPQPIDAGHQLALDLMPMRPPILEMAGSQMDFGTANTAAQPPPQTDAVATPIRGLNAAPRDPNGSRPLPEAGWALMNRGRSSMLGELIGIVGEEAALRLISTFGGTRLYVPHSPEPEDALTASIGPVAAMRLARVYGGDRVDVPNPPPRRMRIIQLRAAGLSVDAIARELRCTRRRVFQVLAEARAPRRPA